MSEDRYCTRHPRVATALSCGRCGSPVCTDCARFGPAGIRCSSCAGHGSHIDTIEPRRFGLAVTAAAIAGFVSGLVIRATAGLGLLGLFWAVALAGALAGEAFHRVSGRKRGLVVEMACLASVWTGCLAGMWSYMTLAQQAAQPTALQLAASAVVALIAMLRIRVR